MNTRVLVFAAIATLGFGPNAWGVAQINVNLVNGEIELTNPSSANLDLAGYSIISPSSSLENTNWLSIVRFYDANDGGEVDPDDNWFFLANNDAEFGEGTLGSATIRPGQIVDLGLGAFVPGGSTDLILEYVDAATDSVEIGIVLYNSGMNLMADYDFDGEVDGQDFLIWQANFGVAANADQSTGDSNGDGAVDGDDFLIWQAEFGAVAAAIGGGGLTAIPEPATAGLWILLWTGAICGRCIRRGPVMATPQATEWLEAGSGRESGTRWRRS